MKKILLFNLVVILTAVTSYAQQGWGITAGANLSKLKVDEGPGYEQDPTKSYPVVRFQAGIYKEIKAKNNIVVTPGLLFIKKGYKTKRQEPFSGQQRDWRVNYAPSYIQLPVDIAYRFHTSNDQYFDAGISVYASYGIGGKAHERIKLDEDVVEDEKFELQFLNKTKIVSEQYGATIITGYSRPLDIGGGIVLNYHFHKKLGIKLNADHSFFNLQSKINGNKPVSSRYNQQLRLAFNYTL